MDNIKDIRIDFTKVSQSAPAYKCSKCEDTGWIRTEKGVITCSCRDEANRLQILELCGMTPILAQKTFDRFDLTLYAEYMHTDSGISYRKCAQDALNACKSYVAAFESGKTLRGIFLGGNVGRGKTFLAAAVCNALIKKGIMPYFMVVPEFLDDIRAGYNGGEYTESRLMNKAMQASFLVLDDCGSHNVTEWTKGKLFTLINYRLNHGLPIMVTSNLNIKEMQDTFGLRVFSRIAEMCDFYFLYSKDDIRLTNNIKRGER